MILNVRVSELKLQPRHDFDGRPHPGGLTIKAVSWYSD